MTLPARSWVLPEAPRLHGLKVSPGPTHVAVTVTKSPWTSGVAMPRSTAVNDAALLPAVAPRAASHVVLAVRSVPCGRRIWVTPTGLPLTVTTQSVRTYTALLHDDSLIATCTNEVPPVALTCF